jgi:transposase
MSGETLNHAFVPRHYDVFAGLDVDKTSVSVTFMNHQETIRSMRIPYSAEHLLNYVRKHFPGQKVAFAYEAGPTGYGLHDQLTDQGHPCLVASASMIPRAPGQRVKTNRLDSQKLSEALRGGQLRSIHVPSLSYRHLRHLTQLRDTFIRQSAATKCRIKALLLFEGIAFPQAPPDSQWSRGVITQLKKLACPGAVRFKLDRLLASLEFTHQQALETMREIRRFCRQDPELHHCIEYLRSIPGIGWIVASHLLARIGDWRQIRNVRQLAAFLGLVPTEHSTGDTIQRGSITRSGDSRLRSKLIQSAWSAIRKDPELREFYRSIYQRHPRDRAARKAIVAVARKLTTRIYAVLHEQRPYVVRDKIHCASLTEEETALPQGTTRRSAEPGQLHLP